MSVPRSRLKEVHVAIVLIYCNVGGVCSAGHGPNSSPEFEVYID